MPKPITYCLAMPKPENHLFEVSCHIESPEADGQKFALPAWIPGSYMIRDFAKQVLKLSAQGPEGELQMTQLDKQSWQCDKSPGPITIRYAVYATDLAPRGAHLDSTHGFFNGARVFMRILEQEQKPCILKISPPQAARYKNWQVATTMPIQEVQPAGFGSYRVENYDALIDYPFEIGKFKKLSFEACGIPHDIFLSGRLHSETDTDRIIRDAKAITEHHLQFFSKPAPFQSYGFLVMVLGEGYGGLEHRNSTALHCSRDSLPRKSDEEVREAYRTFLGLISHEYFHSWLIKRIKPEAFVPYNLAVENYTRQLWIFEGITSYYDELALVRSGVIQQDAYFEMISENLCRYLSTPGRWVQTLETSSLEAWSKFYKPDENSPNLTISYYLKGALVAWLLDLTLRQKTQGQYSLDTMMEAIWTRFGKTGLGLPEGAFENITQEITGLDLSEFFEHSLRTTRELPFEEILTDFGIDYQCVTEKSDKKTQTVVKSNLGVKLKTLGNEAQIAYIYADTAAEAAGLAAGDTIIAIEGLKTDKLRLESMIAEYPVGTAVLLHVFRRDELLTFTAILKEKVKAICLLKCRDDASVDEKNKLKSWLQIKS